LKEVTMKKIVIITSNNSVANYYTGLRNSVCIFNMLSKIMIDESIYN
jgi:hypothetical protein